MKIQKRKFCYISKFTILHVQKQFVHFIYLGRWNLSAPEGSPSKRTKTQILNLHSFVVITNHMKGFRSKP